MNQSMVRSEIIINGQFIQVIIRILMQFLVIIAKLLFFIATSFATYGLHLFVHEHLSTSNIQYRNYLKSVQFVQKLLYETIDLDQHHFQPCRTCGYALALTKDMAFCAESDTYKLLHPKTILEEVVIFRDYAGRDLARKLIQNNYFDALPTFYQSSRTNPTRLYPLPLTTTIIYPYAKNYFRTHTLGFAAGCLFQKYFHVPGQEELALKSNQTTHFKNYLNKLENAKVPKSCITDAEYQKPTFRLWRQNECVDFFNILNSDNYQEHLKKQGILYIYKTNRHLGNGIMLLDYNNERTIRKWYGNGSECGKNSSQVIVQEYVTNPYLYNGHKMEFRTYFQIASTNPPILYGYKKALIKQCALKFNLRDFTKEGHVCNTAVTKSLKDGKGDDDDDLYIDWNLEELQTMLLEQGLIHSADWLHGELYPQIFKKVSHLYMSVKDLLFRDSRVGEFFGVDFILDSDLRLWILECNRNPNFLAVTEGRVEKFGKLIPDMLDIQLAYVRSRFKRVKRFIEEKIYPMIKSNQVQYLYDRKNELKNEFLVAFTDKLEEEYEIDEGNLGYFIQNLAEVNVKNVIKGECLVR